MSNSIKEKLIGRIDQLLEKAERVKATYKPDPPNVTDFPTLDKDVFFEWKSGVENLIVKIAGENSSYYKNFLEHFKSGHRSHVDSGVGILRALKEDLELDVMSTTMNTNENMQNYNDSDFQYYREKIIVLCGVIITVSTGLLGLVFKDSSLKELIGSDITAFVFIAGAVFALFASFILSIITIYFVVRGYYLQANKMSANITFVKADKIIWWVLACFLFGIFVGFAVLMTHFILGW